MFVRGKNKITVSKHFQVFLKKVNKLVAHLRCSRECGFSTLAIAGGWLPEEELLP